MANDVELTVLQRRFIEEYLSDPERNATKAARRAGYAYNSAAQMASEILKKPHVKAAIEERQGKLLESFGITETRILQELAKIGFANIQDFAALTEDGGSIRNVPRDQTAAIKEVTIEQTDNGRFSVKKTKLSLADKQAALVQMGKHLGMFKEKVEHSGTFTLQRLVEDSMIEEAPIEGETIDLEALEPPEEE